MKKIYEDNLSQMKQGLRLIKNTNESGNLYEYLIPFIGAIALLISCVFVSSKKFFWNDELLSFYLLNDSDFTHMMVAWGDTFNQAPPLYFILGWLWAKVFSTTELSLRLFSSLGICVAFILVWITLRRTYNFWATSIGTLSVFCLSDVILYQNSEVRMYGLFAAVCAIGFFQYDLINKSPKNSVKILILNSLIHAAIVLTHLYGILYSGAILFAFIIRDRYFKFFRSSVYLSVICGWLSLIPCIAPLLNQSNNHAKWFSVVTITQFFRYFIVSEKFSWLILVLLFASIFLYISQPKGNKTLETPDQKFYPDLIDEIPLLILAVTFIMVPVFAWIITKTIKPMLNERYIIPTFVISLPIIVAYLNERIFPDFSDAQRNLKKFTFKKKFFKHRKSVIFATLTVLLLIQPIGYAKYFTEYIHRPGINDDSFGYSSLPIAMEAGHDFLPRFHYSPMSKRYFHILDWETAINNTSSPFATGDYTHLQALKRNYPFINSIQSKDFLEKNDQFLVLNEQDQKWYENRVKNNKQYNTKLLGSVEGAWGLLEVFLVERKK